MNQKTVFGLVFVAFFGFFSSPVFAQFNLKAGYNFSIVSDPGLNDVIKTFSVSQPYTSDFQSLGWLHGFEAGVRYASDVHGFELTYQNGYQHLSAKGTLSGTETAFTDKINFSIQSAGIGYQIAGELFGLGADLQYQWYRTKVELSEPVSKFKDTQKMMGMKYYLMLTLRGNGTVDAAVQPYVIVPFGNYNHDPLSLFLNQESELTSKKWTRFGLSILFYNGDK